MKGLGIILAIIGIPLLFLGTIFIILSVSLGQLIPLTYKLLEAISNSVSSYISLSSLTSALPNPNSLYSIGIVFFIIGIAGVTFSDYRGKGLVYSGTTIIIASVIAFLSLGIELIIFPTQIQNALTIANESISQSQILLAGYSFEKNTIIFSVGGILLIIVGTLLNRHFNKKEKIKEEKLKNEEESKEKIIEEIIQNQLSHKPIILDPNNVDSKNNTNSLPSNIFNPDINKTNNQDQNKKEDNPFKPI